MLRNDYFYYIKDKLKSRKDKENEEKRIQKLKELEPELMKEMGKLEEKWEKDNSKETDFDKLIRPTLGLEKKEEDKTTLGEMRKKAEDKYRDEYMRDKDNVNKKYDSNARDTQKELEDIYNNESDDLRTLKEKYARLRSERLSKTNDKGIGKSSIARLIGDEISDEESTSRDDIKRGAKARADRQMDILESLKEERDDALSKLDVKRALDIASEIHSLEKDQRRKNNEVKEYNNTVDRRESEYSLKRGEAIDKIRDRRHQQELADLRYEKHYGYRADKDENYRERLDMAMKFYDQMPHPVAIESIKQNRELKKLLGSYYEYLLAHERYRKD